MNELTYFSIVSPIGEMRIYVHDDQPVLITLPGNDAPGGESAQNPPSALTARLLDALAAYFNGREVSFGLAKSLVDSLATTPFERAVLMEVARIPCGETRSYGEIAELAGYARAARAVGNVMHENPFPIVIPCHRVIKGDGSIGGYGGAEEIKMWLLRFEGREPEK